MASDAVATGSGLHGVLGRVPDDRVRLAAWTVCGLSVLCVLADCVVLAITQPAGPPPWWAEVAGVLGFSGAPVVGALIVSRFPHLVYGWLWLGLGAAIGLLACIDVAETRMPSSDTQLGWASGMLIGWSYVGALLCVIGILLLFPDSRPPSPRWRWVMPAALSAAVMTSVAGPLTPGPQNGAAPSPWAASGALGEIAVIIVNAGVVVLFGLILASAVAVPLRWRRADPVQRRQLKWFALGAAWFAPAFVLSALLSDALPELVTAVVFFSQFVVLQVAVGIAMLRHGLYDVDRVINRTLLYALVSGCLVVLYLGVVVVASLVLADHVEGVPQAVATAAVALAVLPVRARAQRAVDRLTFGSRGDPYEVLSQLGHQVQAAADPHAVLEGIVRSVAVTLRLPYVAIRPRRGDDDLPGVAYGEAQGTPVRFVLTHQGEPVGVLLAAPRSVREELTLPDRRLLADLARHAGVAAHAYLLADDLRRSRAHVLATREEERRRLRRDLHDGLGPTLAAVALGLDTARRRLDDPERVAAMLASLSTELQNAIEEVRRLAHDLRPPALDQFGLVEAIRGDARRFETEAGAGARALSIRVDAPPTTPPLPAAVEVAAYRIVGEALTNVVRHSGAQRCIVSVSFDDRLHLEITDDGRGVPPEHRRGVGLSSMVERAVEVGGRCEIDSADRQGTHVRAELPLEAPT
ncbi:sensor histidine kinase [Cellulomonas palmilytica]|uniref:sensor histidine kinase n=1 Tax=Cellulomonas palmilytica TaxID=2608402 RepID=UPI001F40A5CA|nr:sensor histidine kinase [Cellulomonas palmilytica]UJP41327.1 sensor histidine kinase [Cellulomonas palmilytica]